MIGFLADLHSLQDQIIAAWQERAVMLSMDEQKRLRDEIRATSALLDALTLGS
jgi:uncharacterized protein YukE